MIERLARLANRRARRTLVLAGVFFLLAGALGAGVADRLDPYGADDPDTESVIADQRLEDAGFRETGVVVLIEDRARVGSLAAELRRDPDVASVARGPLSRDGRSTYLAASLRPTDDDARQDAAERIADDLAGEPGVTVGGPAVAQKEVNEHVESDLRTAELYAFPLLFLLSLLFFRGRAAILPLVVGVTTVLGTFLVLTGINQVYGLSVFALNLVMGLGLGLAIDYTLFLVTRFREELANGAQTRAAVRTTMATAGRTVAFSAATVAAALATLTVFPLGFAQSMGIAGASVAIVAALASLAVSPALLAMWGHKLLRRDAAGAAAAEDRWFRLAHWVMRRPGVIAITTAAVMLAIALPAAGVHWTPVDSTVIPAERALASSPTRSSATSAAPARRPSPSRSARRRPTPRRCVISRAASTPSTACGRSRTPPTSATPLRGGSPPPCRATRRARPRRTSLPGSATCSRRSRRR